MTFEEFFTKKKIDLEQLKQVEPSLFFEFQNHFDLMGEKSFDHTKKFWFNKLRRSYRLKEAPKPEKEVIVKDKIASQAEPLSSPTIDQMPVEEPILNATDFSEEAKIQTEVIDTSLRPKFTPRNIIAKSKDTPEGEDTADRVTKDEATKAVGFKPRFKASTTPTQEGDSGGKEPESKSQESEPAEAKPSPYRPKFNLQNISKRAEPTAEPEELKEEPPAEITPSEPEKPAYRPRFNLKNIPKKVETPETGKEELPSQAQVDTPTPEPKDEVKPAYKPRFNMKNTKPKTEE